MKITMRFNIDGLDIVEAMSLEDDAQAACDIAAKLEEYLRSRYLVPVSCVSEDLAPACFYGDYPSRNLVISYDNPKKP